MKRSLLRVLRANSLLSTIAVVTVLLFGGWSGAVIGWILGITTSWMPIKQKQPVLLQESLEYGLQSGFSLGLWLFVSTLVQGLFLQDNASLLRTVIQAVVALSVTLLSAVFANGLRTLPKPRSEQAMFLTLIVMLVLFPWVDLVAQTNWIAAVVQIQIFVVLALGLNVTVGYAGLLDLGYAAFFAIGAYTTGLLSSPQVGVQWSFWLIVWIAAAIAAIAGVLLGLPALRLRGDYLAIVTLGFGEIMPIIFRNLTEVRLNEPISSLVAQILNRPELQLCLIGCAASINLTGGEAGINPIGRPALPLIGTFQPGRYLPWYYLILGVVLGSVWILHRLYNSRLGRAWTAIREDELAAQCMGIHLLSTKVLAFGIGASFAGVAGAFYAAYISAIFPSVFGFSLSIIILCMVILGGLGNINGVILGSVLITAVDQLYLPRFAQVFDRWLNTFVLPHITSPEWREFFTTSLDPTQMRLFVFGLILVVMMRVRPEGLLPDRRQAALFNESSQRNA